MKYIPFFALTTLCVSSVVAQGISDISIEPKSPSLNQSFKVTINSNGDTPACGLQINLGDGTTRDIRAEKFPVIVDHTYAKEGNFAIAVNGKMIMRGLSSMFPCAGDAKTLVVGIGTQSGSPVDVKEQVNPQTQVPATVTAQPQIQPQTKFFTKHIAGEEPKWIMEYLQSFQKNVCPMYTVCNMHSSWRENLQVCNLNFENAGGNIRIDYYLERISKSYDAVNELQKGLFTSQNCKKEIKNASDFLVNNPLNEISNTYTSNFKSWQDKNRETIAQQDLKDKNTAAENKRNEDLQKAKYATSPQGKIESLKDKYVAMMAVNECHELRKNYVVKYIDIGVYENARTAMKTFENKIKKDVPSINTDKIWQDAVTQYKSSLVGISLDANKINPQNINKDNRGMCLIMASELIESAPKEAPKKNF